MTLKNGVKKLLQIPTVLGYQGPCKEKYGASRSGDHNRHEQRCPVDVGSCCRIQQVTHDPQNCNQNDAAPHCHEQCDVRTNPYAPLKTTPALSRDDPAAKDRPPVHNSGPPKGERRVADPASDAPGKRLTTTNSECSVSDGDEPPPRGGSSRGPPARTQRSIYSWHTIIAPRD